jgi:cytochrome c
MRATDRTIQRITVISVATGSDEFYWRTQPVRQAPSIAAVLALSFMLAGVSAGQARAAGDPTNGAKIFKMKCVICHSTQAGQNKVGPSLAGVFDHKAATAPNYSYSEAMKKSGLTWDSATLDSYLAGPRAKVPGTKMTFAGLSKESDRVDIIAYLGTLK